MKRTVVIPAITIVLLAGCSDKSDSTSPVTAPVDYLKANANAQQKAVKVVDTTSLNQAIQMFNVDEGRYPKDLNELIEKKYFPKLPETPHGTKLDYDPNTGTVKVVNQ